jgi:hypothetical protein
MSTPNISQGTVAADFFPEPLADPAPADYDFDYDALLGLSSADFMEAAKSPHPFAVDQFPAELVSDAPTGTISPKDLMMDSSVPPSTSFTDLSTPSFDSPGNFSQNPSPMFTDVDLVSGHEAWSPLFHDSDAVNAFDAALTESKYPQSVATVAVPASPAPMKRTASAATKQSSPDSASATRHSSVAGVNARSRKPLSPIQFDESDPVAAKRARNTEAARKSRARKMERQAVSERRIAELEEILAERDQEISYLKSKLQAQESYQ